MSNSFFFFFFGQKSIIIIIIIILLKTYGIFIPQTRTRIHFGNLKANPDTIHLYA